MVMKRRKIGLKLNVKQWAKNVTLKIVLVYFKEKLHGFLYMA